MPARASAQSRDALEITPFGGYRFGGGFYEIASGRAVDVDGAASFGLVVDIPFSPDMQIEAMVTRQQARFALPGDPAGTRWRVTVDHYQLGGLTEFGKGRSRPFLTGTLGLTRYESAGDNEVRFAGAAGGGVKLFPTPHLGLRLDGRLYGTLVDADVDALFCGPRGCIGSIDAWFVWQAEFTAGLTFRF
ncbi:MAG TPA: hypothetical protein VF147_09475 [Vicinamibacterales bacterium]